MTQPKALLHLQEIEQKITRAQNRIKEIDLILINDQGILAAQNAVKSAEEHLKPLQKQARELEFDIDTTANKAADTENRLYSGNIKNPKELQDMQLELTSLKTRQDKLEETILELMVEIEQAEENLLDKNQILERTTKSRQTENKLLVLERESKLDEINQLRPQLETAANAINPEIRSLYAQLSQRTPGTAVVRMTSDATCSRCGVQQNRTDETNIRRGQIIQCSNCRRILVF